MENKKHDLPAMPFYVGDWLKCPEVRSLAPDCRGLWFDLICFMWESTERGVMVKPSGKPYSDSEIIRMVGLDNQNSGDWLNTLIENNVCSRREDGAIFSRRMLKEERIRVMRREVGRKGGNPNLINRSVNQKVNQNIEYENEDETEDRTKALKEGGKGETITDAHFEEVWNEYPVKDGKKTALRHFKTSVKTLADLEALKLALGKYKASERVKKGFVKNGSTWFNNWRDWIEYKEPEKALTDMEKADLLIAKMRATK